MDKEKLHKSQVDYYTALVDEHGDSNLAVGTTIRSQRKRFMKLVEVGDLDGHSVLDVGCGLADLYGYLKREGVHADYYGFDITPGMIKIAKEKYPEIADHFSVLDIFKEESPRSFDYVVCAGVLNLPIESGNIPAMVEFVQKMLTLSNIGIALSMTSALTRKPSPDTYYFSPAEVIERVSAFCPAFRVDHTYLPHDFTLFCYKKDLYD